jgi:putative ABC transport system substrate-binding protein
MRRRQFIALLGGAAGATWPLTARAQREQKRRVAVLMGGLLSGDANGQAEAGALEDALQELGWRQGGNIELSYRWPGAELDSVRAAASEIAASRPDLVVSRTTPATSALMSAGLPTVFVLVADPIRSGFVQNLAHPGGNVTGFSNFEASVGGKWLELLKEAAPSISHVTVVFNPQTAPFAEAYLHADSGGYRGSRSMYQHGRTRSRGCGRSGGARWRNSRHLRLFPHRASRFSDYARDAPSAARNLR